MDYIKMQALTPEQAVRQKLNEIKNKELETKSGVKLAIRNIKRNELIDAAQTHKFSDADIQTLLTSATLKQVKDLSKPLTK